ncbi:hypothetical protein [Flavobacterium ovatum]|uniref:hypothetical protein n=1 Tax=Flavobacterium ovatum TaxID=1928857 RepID=UPI00344F480C
MTLQFIHDKQGNTTGVHIPIEEWQKLKTKYSDLQEEEAQDSSELSSWQKNILNERLEDYYKKPNDIVDFYTTLDKIRKGI